MYTDMMISNRYWETDNDERYEEINDKGRNGGDGDSTLYSWNTGVITTEKPYYLRISSSQ